MTVDTSVAVRNCLKYHLMSRGTSIGWDRERQPRAYTSGSARRLGPSLSAQPGCSPPAHAPVPANSTVLGGGFVFHRQNKAQNHSFIGFCWLSPQSCEATKGTPRLSPTPASRRSPISTLLSNFSSVLRQRMLTRAVLELAKQKYPALNKRRSYASWDSHKQVVGSCATALPPECGPLVVGLPPPPST